MSRKTEYEEYRTGVKKPAPRLRTHEEWRTMVGKLKQERKDYKARAEKAEAHLAILRERVNQLTHDNKAIIGSTAYRIANLKGLLGMCRAYVKDCAERTPAPLKATVESDLARIDKEVSN